jgi:adenine deaminase
MIRVLPPLDAASVAAQVRAALGVEPVDLIIRGARLVNVFTEQVEPAGAVAVARGRVVSLGPEMPGWLGPNTKVLEAEGLFLLPGLIDAHTHLDSIFTLNQYASYALASGNTTAISECAMMAGAWGLRGVEAMLDEAATAPMRLFWTAPPLVPPFSDLETSAGLPYSDFASLLKRPDFVGVGEVYWPAVTDQDPRVGRRFALAQELGKTQEGHAAGARGERLTAYAASGISSCHEAINVQDALDRLRLGIAVQVRQGFVRKEMDKVVPGLKDLPDTRLVSLVTDLAEPLELMQQGAMNPLLKKAVELGVPPARAVAWCSLNPATHFGLERLGGLAPGWVADMVLVDDLINFKAKAVFLAGRQVAADGKLTIDLGWHQYPDEAHRTIQCPELKPAALRVPGSGDRAMVRVAAFAGDTITKETQISLPVVSGEVQPDPDQDVQKLVHVNRHTTELKLSIGFVSGWGLKQGALATTLEWDTNNLIVLGANDADIVSAANRVRELGGGIVLATDGEIMAELPFPIASVISPLSLPEIVKKMRALAKGLRELGCGLARPLLTIQTICFTGLPFLRLTDKGLVDIRKRQFVEVIVQ